IATAPGVNVLLPSSLRNLPNGPEPLADARGSLFSCEEHDFMLNTLRKRSVCKHTAPRLSRARQQAAFGFFLFAVGAWAAVIGSVRGIVHDPDHRPLAGAQVTVKSASSDFSQKAVTADDGSFEVAGLPVGAYNITATHSGFAETQEQVVVTSGSSSVVHF